MHRRIHSSTTRNKALCALRQAPKVWFDTIRAFLIFHGFNSSTLDDCFPSKKYSDGISIDLAIHADDGFITTDTFIRMESLLSALEDKFRIIKTTRGIRYEYLSVVLNFDQDSRSISISMPKYAARILNDYPMEQYKQVQIPHSPDLSRINNSPKLSKEEQKLLHSTVMRILFYAIPCQVKLG